MKMNESLMLKSCLAVGLGVMTTLAAPTAYAVTTLRITHFLPAVSNAQQQVLEPWCQDLATQSDQQLKCQLYPSMQLGGTPGQLADMVRNGVVDIAWTALGYSAGRFPRSEVMELPFMLPAGGEDASRIVWDFSQGPAAQDFKDYKVLAVHSDGGSVFHTRSGPIKTLDDMQGLRLRAPTRLASELVDALGASAVSMPPAQIADTLSKGVIDGAAAAWEVVPPTKLDEVTAFHTETAEHQATPTVTVLALLMNKRSYDRLSEKDRKVLDSLSGEALSLRFGKAWDSAIANARQKAAADPEQTITTLDDKAYDDMRDATRSVVDDWADSDSGGIDRQALVDELKQEVRQQQPDLQ